MMRAPALLSRALAAFPLLELAPWLSTLAPLILGTRRRTGSSLILSWLWTGSASVPSSNPRSWDARTSPQAKPGPRRRTARTLRRLRRRAREEGVMGSPASLSKRGRWEDSPRRGEFCVFVHQMLLWFHLLVQIDAIGLKWLI
jgi:hypothetical protein